MRCATVLEKPCVAHSPILSLEHPRVSIQHIVSLFAEPACWRLACRRPPAGTHKRQSKLETAGATHARAGANDRSLAERLVPASDTASHAVLTVFARILAELPRRSLLDL